MSVVKHRGVVFRLNIDMYLAVRPKDPPKSFLNQILTVHCILISEVKGEYVENMRHFTCTYFPGASLDVPQEGYQFF